MGIFRIGGYKSRGYGEISIQPIALEVTIFGQNTKDLLNGITLSNKEVFSLSNIDITIKLIKENNSLFLTIPQVSEFRLPIDISYDMQPFAIILKLGRDETLQLIDKMNEILKMSGG